MSDSVRECIQLHIVVPEKEKNKDIEYCDGEPNIMSKSSFMIIPLNYWLQEQQKLFWRSVSILLWLLLAWNKHILRRQDAAYQFIALELASWILNVTRQEDIGCISKYNRLTFHTLNRAKLLRSEILLYTNPLLVIFFHILPVKLNGGMAPTSWILQIVVLVPRDQRSNVSCTSLYHSVLCKVCTPSQLQNQNYTTCMQLKPARFFFDTRFDT